MLIPSSVWEGAQAMLRSGILEQPTVDAALGIHVMPTEPIGHLYFPKGVVLSSSDIGCAARFHPAYIQYNILIRWYRLGLQGLKAKYDVSRRINRVHRQMRRCGMTSFSLILADMICTPRFSLELPGF